MTLNADSTEASPGGNQLNRAAEGEEMGSAPVSHWGRSTQYPRATVVEIGLKLFRSIDDLTCMEREISSTISSEPEIRPDSDCSGVEYSRVGRHNVRGVSGDAGVDGQRR